MSRAEQIIPLILHHEGGFVNNPKDPGGPTNKGITIATFRRYVKKDGTVADLKALTTAQATIVYKRQYWDAVSADLLPFGVDYSVADFAVNSGPGRAIKMLQRVVGVVEDGRLGPATLAAVRAMPPSQTIQELNASRLVFMKTIRGGSLWKTFGRGWQRRVDEVTTRSLTDTSASPQMPAPKAEKTGWLAPIIAAFAAFFTRSK